MLVVGSGRMKAKFKRPQQMQSVAADVGQHVILKTYAFEKTVKRKGPAMSDFDPDFENPYRAPTTVDAPPPLEVDGEAAAIRREHLKHEASIQGIGSLYVLGGICLCLIGLISFGTMASLPVNGQAGGNGFAFGLVIMILMLGIGALQFSTGLGMRKVRPWVKIPATILAALGLLSFPVGTLINLYVLYLLHSKKGQVVLAESYQNIIAQTPEIKYKTSMIVKVLAVILFAFIAFAIGAALLSAR